MSEPTICSETASPLPAWDIYTFILLSCPLRCSHMQCLSPGAIHQTGPLVVMGWLVLALSSVPGTICSLVARGGTCLAFALVKHSTQNECLNFTSANDCPK